MDGIVFRLADRAAAQMRREGIPPVEAVSAVFRESYGGGFDDELKRAILRELGRRGGKASAKARRAKELKYQERLQQMFRESRMVAFQRRDHLLPDLYA